MGRNKYENVVVHRMSPAVWSILQPHKNPEDWQEVMQPDSINSFFVSITWAVGKSRSNKC